MFVDGWGLMLKIFWEAFASARLADANGAGGSAALQSGNPADLDMGTSYAAYVKERSTELPFTNK